TFLRDVSYIDTHGKRFVSSATREVYLLIQSNKRKMLEYTMMQVYEDLYLEPHEEERLQTIFEQTSSVDHTLYRQMEQNTRRNRIVEIFEGKLSDYNVEPSELIVKGNRTLVYSAHDIPIFGILLDIEGVPLHDTKCVGLRTFQRKEALHKEPIIPQLPLIQEWISYEVVEKDIRYRDNFFYAWFAGMEQSLRKILKGRRLLQQLSITLGCESLIFSKDAYILSFSPSDRIKIDEGFIGKICLRIDESNYDHHHIVFQLPDTRLRLSDHQKSLGYTYYTKRLKPATQRTERVGFKINWKKESIENMERSCILLWNIVIELWMFPMCTRESIGGAKAYMDPITTHLQSLIPSGLCFTKEEQKFLWFSTLKPDEKASIFKLPLDKRWGYMYHTGKSTIHIGLRCREGLLVPPSLQSSVTFCNREGLLFAQWNVNKNSAALDELLSMIDYHHENTKPFLMSQSLFVSWMTYLVHKGGYIIYELIQHIQGTSVSVAELSGLLEIPENRVRRLCRVITGAKDHLCVIQEGRLFLNSEYETCLTSWLQYQEQNHQMIYNTLSFIEKKLNTIFPSEGGWVVEFSRRFRASRIIQVSKQSWCYGMMKEQQVAIAIEANRGFFNSVKLIGVVGQFSDEHHHPLRDALFHAVQSHTVLGEREVKQSQGWLVSSSMPKEIQETGGAEWTYTTLELQQQLAKALCQELELWKDFEAEIDDFVQKHKHMLELAWNKEMEAVYQQPMYRGLVFTEEILSLSPLKLSKELLENTRSLCIDINQYIEEQSWQTTLRKVQMTGYSVWDRKGIIIESSLPILELFVGCLNTQTSDGHTRIDDQGGIDLAITLSVRRKSAQSNVLGANVIVTDEWNQLVERLNQAEHDWIVKDEEDQSNSIVYSIQLNIPLSNIWKGCSTAEERYNTYRNWIQKGLDLVMQNGEWKSVNEVGE
ncbi:MAG: hypothetical protein CL916_15225, partial [Deltaproteobacteria bacterium]|nr:hypothetical protein [Deltaproteobacteria bacterium]